MFPAQSYLTIYDQGMLALVLLTSLVYAQGSSKSEFSISFNAFMIWAIGGLLIFFIGTRPIDGTFVDMTTYAMSFEIQKNGGGDSFSDWGFTMLSEFVGRVGSAELFFAVCAAIYILPLMIGAQRIHGKWSYPALLAFAGAMSFFSYGVNGIRNGMSTSLLIAAFAFWDRKLIMVLLMVAAESMHKSALVPIVAFVIAGFYTRPLAYGLVWLGALGASAVAGEKLSGLLVGLSGFGDDERLARYAGAVGFGGDKGGFRLDFILYSIVPVIISYGAASASTRKDLFYRRLVCTYLLANSFWLIAMYAAYSNRFAYLSWFLMPWVIVYPFIPQSRFRGSQRIGMQEAGRPEFLGLALVAHFAFTYVMDVLVYSNR